MSTVTKYATIARDYVVFRTMEKQNHEEVKYWTDLAEAIVNKYI
ncbi:hypothetical protein JCM19376_20900 [Fusibacter bizertensis]